MIILIFRAYGCDTIRILRDRNLKYGSVNSINEGNTLFIDEQAMVKMITKILGNNLKITIYTIKQNLLK